MLPAFSNMAFPLEKPLNKSGQVPEPKISFDMRVINVIGYYQSKIAQSWLLLEFV